MNKLKIINGFLPEQHSLSDNAFEEIYISLRKKEGRLFAESEIVKLPAVATSHPHYKEWLIRKNSCNKLCNYVKQKKHVCNILEVGCGNGWLAAHLAGVAGGKVTGTDVNEIEVEQAKVAFNRMPNLHFIVGDIRSDILEDNKFDMIVFAASIQYFESLKEIVNTALRYVTLQGEIHIIDSHFYKSDQIAAAKKRTDKYFLDSGFPEMSQFYFHHSLQELQSFSYSVLYNPHSWTNKLLPFKNRFHGQKNPFYWVCVKNNYL